MTQAGPGQKAEGENQAGQGIEATKTLTTKTGKIRHEVRVDLLGNKSDIWWDAANQIQDSSNGNSPIISTGGLLDGSYVDYSKSDFPAFDWVSKANFVGMRTVLGKKCWVFTENRLGISEESKEIVQKQGNYSPKQYEFPITAYIDADTRLPVLLAWGQESIRVTFLPPPQAMQTLPASIAKAESKVKETQQAMRSPHPKPF